MKELIASLALLRQQGVIKNFFDCEIVPGQEWNSVIRQQLDDAEIILLCVSRHFLNSDYIYRVELQAAMDRHKAGTATVIPVILEVADWQGAHICPLAGPTYRSTGRSKLAKPRGSLDRCGQGHPKGDRSASHHPNLLAGSALHRLRLRSRLSLRDNETELVLKARSQTGRLVSPGERIRKWGQIFTFVLDNDTAGTMARCSINRELRRRWKHFFYQNFYTSLAIFPSISSTFCSLIPASTNLHIDALSIITSSTNILSLT